MLRLPADIYPNSPQQVSGTPAAVFRDHRWTLPAIFAAAEAGLLTLPVTVVSFDRHRDSLAPADPALLAAFRNNGGMEDLTALVRDVLSPRDDDWITAGMELGIISDVVQFAVDDLRAEETAETYTDATGTIHRLFRLGRPGGELSWKGALADHAHPSAAAGLWDTLGWDAMSRSLRPPGGLVLDIDLDAFTFSWERYTFPYTPEIWEGEYLRPVQSAAEGAYTAADFVRTLAVEAALVTIATEPGFCGGAANARGILEDANRHLFGGALDTAVIEVDYPAKYPEE